MKTEYRLNYNRYNVFEGKVGYIISGKTFETKKELRTFIKEMIKEKDIITSIIEVKTKRLNIEDFK